MSHIQEVYPTFDLGDKVTIDGEGNVICNSNLVNHEDGQLVSNPDDKENEAKNATHVTRKSNRIKKSR